MKKTEKNFDSGRFFTQKLMEWDKNSNNRAMPWKKEKDPYKIWISEIILQQTRVEQGREYYNRFISKYPDVKSLAKAKDNEVFKLWEGLGYYSRCRNLLMAARFIQNDCKGKFPDTYEVILSLKGVGPYSAAAIASFAYNLPHAVVDGNVMRVLSRFFRIATPIDTTEGKKTFNELAQSLLDSKNAGLYNQAIMDLGATVCKPQSPVCNSCPLSKRCISYKEGDMNLYPAKSKKIKIRHRWFNYFIIQCGESYYVRKRKEKDIWQQLHEFVLIETEKAITAEEWSTDYRLKNMLGRTFKVISQTDLRMQKLTHQHVHGSFFTIAINKAVELDGYERKTISQIKRLAFPMMIAEFLRENRFLQP